MTRVQAWLVHTANVLVGGSGLVWAWMLYVATPADEFALQNHALQDEVQAAHILFAPLLVFAAGIAWAVHAAPHLARRTHQRRRSGIALVALLVPMAASGYLLQVAVDEVWREYFLVLHLATSGAWLLAYAIHQFTPISSASDR